MMHDEISILRQGAEAGFDSQGRPREIYRVDYMVGTDGPFTLRVPAAEFAPSEIERQIRAHAEQLGQVRAAFHPRG